MWKNRANGTTCASAVATTSKTTISTGSFAARTYASLNSLGTAPDCGASVTIFPCTQKDEGSSQNTLQRFCLVDALALPTIFVIAQVKLAVEQAQEATFQWLEASVAQRNSETNATMGSGGANAGIDASGSS